MSKLLPRVPVVLLSALVAACHIAQYRWYNDSVAAADTEQRFQIDRGACTAEAYRTLGPAPNSGSTVTNFTATSSSGETMTGQATTQQGNSIGSIAEGMAQSQRQIDYQNAVTNLVNGCMASRGWALRQVAR